MNNQNIIKNIELNYNNEEILNFIKNNEGYPLYSNNYYNDKESDKYINYKLMDNMN